MAHKFPRKGQTNLGNIPAMNTPGNSPETDAYAEKRRGDRAKELKPAIKSALGTHGPKGKLPEEVELSEESMKDCYDCGVKEAKKEMKTGTSCKSKYEKGTDEYKESLRGYNSVMKNKEVNEKKMTDDEMAKREKIVKSMKKGFAGFRQRYGKDAKSVMYATATKQAMKEDAETLDEGIEVKKEYSDKKETEHGVYHNGKKIGYVVHHKPSGTHTAYHDPQGDPEDNDYGQIDDFRSHHDAVSQIRNSAGVSVHEEIDPKVRTQDTLKGQEPTAQKDDVGPGSNAKSTKVKFRGGPMKEEVKKSDVPAFLRKARGDKPLTVADAKAGSKDSISSKENLAKARGVSEGKGPESDTVPFVTNAEQPPFDGPYKKIGSTVTDKSGAQHTPMSRARDLARAAMKRIKTEMLGIAPGNNG